MYKKVIVYFMYKIPKQHSSIGVYNRSPEKIGSFGYTLFGLPTTKKSSYFRVVGGFLYPRVDVGVVGVYEWYKILKLYSIFFEVLNVMFSHVKHPERCIARLSIDKYAHNAIYIYLYRIAQKIFAHKYIINFNFTAHLVEDNKKNGQDNVHKN
ncbi:hypothetical protein ACJX0J_013703, partial [Zea mays]